MDRTKIATEFSVTFFLSTAAENNGREQIDKKLDKNTQNMI
jgi:hypothetical protein